MGSFKAALYALYCLQTAQNCKKKWALSRYGSVFLKKTKKYLWFRKLIVCYKPSPLDWIMMIWTIFGLPGALWGPKRSM